MVLCIHQVDSVLQRCCQKYESSCSDEVSFGIKQSLKKEAEYNGEQMILLMLFVAVEYSMFWIHIPQPPLLSVLFATEMQMAAIINQQMCGGNRIL